MILEGAGLDILWGLVIGLSGVGSAHLLGFDRDRSYYPTLMIVIASIYILFAVMAVPASALLPEAIAATAFIALAIAGHRWSLWLVVLALLGRLDDYETRSGYVIAPHVYWSPGLAQLNPDPHEVALVKHVPLAVLNAPGSPVLEPGDTPGRPILRLSVGEDNLHAPTAALLYQFREVAMHGRYLSVAHFDQPDFARR